ncbi:MAG: hypothetical protein WAT93_10640 [Pontixanthobacter sp.]
MKKILPLVALAGLMSATAVTPSFAEDSNANGEAELAKLLEGRVAGDPVNCLSQAQRRNMEIVDDTAMVFRDGKTLYVNRTSSPQFLSDWDYPVFTMHGSSLCKLDWVEMRSRGSNFPGPNLTLEQFVPYTKLDVAAGN